MAYYRYSRRPYRYRYNRYRRARYIRSRARFKSRFRPRYRRRARPAIQNINSNPFPKKMTRRLRFVKQFTLTSGVGTVGRDDYYINSILTPDGVANSALGFDEAMSIYDKWVVIGSKITVEILTGVNESENMQVALELRDSPSAAVTDIQIVKERQNTKWRMLTGNSDGSGSTGRTKITMQTAPLKFLNRDFEDKEVIGDQTTLPTKLGYYVIYVQDYDKAANVSLTYDVIIDFVAVFFDAKQLIPST